MTIESAPRTSRRALLGFSARARHVWLLPTFFGIHLLIFVLVHATPGDPSLALGDSSGPDAQSSSSALVEQRAEFRAEHLLDAPLWKQYLHYLGPFDLSARGHRWFGGSGEHPWGGVLTFDFGHEFRRPQVSVGAELLARLEVTVPFAALALALSFALAIPLGILCALKRGQFVDRAIGSLLVGLFSLPVFWASLLLVLVFGATGLDWLPVLGLHDKDAAQLSDAGSLFDLARHAILPLVAFSYGGLAYLARQMRSSMIETLESDFIRAARAKGLPESRVLWAHAVPNAIFPMITLVGSLVPTIVGGSILVEVVFQIPGMGRYAYEGFLQRDYNIVMATTFVSAVMTLAGLWFADFAYAVVDPRVRRA